MKRFIGLGLVLGILLSAFLGQAGAQTKAPQLTDDEALLHACEQSLACRSHLGRANRLYEQNSYAAALDEYQAAYVLEPYPLILYNIARIHHKQTHLSDAITYYQRYIDTAHVERAARAKELLSQAKQEIDSLHSLLEPPPAPLIPESPLSITAPLPPITQETRQPIYKKWSFKKNLNSDGGRVLERVGSAGQSVAIGHFEHDVRAWYGSSAVLALTLSSAEMLCTLVHLGLHSQQPCESCLKIYPV